jgi:hypothetical protein
MPNSKYLIFFFILALPFYGIKAQSGNWDVGFELGWTYSSLNGPSETNDQGDEVESFDFNAGFHLLIFGKYQFTDRFGLQGGLQYAKRGGKYNDSGDSWFLFGAQTDLPRFGFGTRDEVTEYNNAYIDLPVLAFYKVSPKLEVGAGLYAGLLLSSKGTGEVRFNGASINGRIIEPFIMAEDFDYKKDNFGVIHNPFQEIQVDSRVYQVPRFATTYFDFLEDPGEKAFNNFDAGFIGQIGYYFNRSLNLKAKLMYGITDVTNDDFDRSKFRLTGNNDNFIFKSDKDTNLSIQISLGFAF